MLLASPRERVTVGWGNLGRLLGRGDPVSEDFFMIGLCPAKDSARNKPCVEKLVNSLKSHRLKQGSDPKLSEVLKVLSGC